MSRVVAALRTIPLLLLAAGRDVTGAIDLANASQLRSRLDAVPDRGTVVDLAGVPLLSTAGATVLLDLRHRLHRAGAQLVDPRQPTATTSRIPEVSHDHQHLRPLQ